jgi:hypothetical protein
MRSVNFKPWVGKHYNRPECLFGVKLMILGESHYSREEPSDKDAPRFAPKHGDLHNPKKKAEEKATTIRVIKKFGIGHPENQGRTFTKIAKLVLNRRVGQLTEAERSDVWQHLVFYNFVQEYVGKEARVRPTSQMWAKGVEPLLSVLRKYDPELILVLGNELKDNVKLTLDDYEGKSNATVCYVRHPATSFSYEIWCPEFQKALMKAKHRKSIKR